VSKVGQRTESFNLSPEPRTKDRRPQSSSGARSSVFIRKLHCMHFAIKRRYLMKSWYLPSLLCIQTSSTNFHNSEFEERLTSPAPKARARADVSAKFRQGILNSAKSIPVATRRFEPMETRKSLIREGFSCLERFSAWSASIIQFRMSSSQ